MREFLKIYRNRLINLSSNNRTLLLLKLFKGRFLDIKEFDYEYGLSGFGIIESLVSGGKKITLSDELDTHSPTSNEMSIKIKKIKKTEQFIFEECGAKNLYVGWPFIRGKFLNETSVNCPLIFFPVDLLLEDNKWKLKKKKDENAILNKTFLLAYGFYNGIELKNEDLEITLSPSRSSVIDFITELYKTFRDSKFELNFNSSIYNNTLKKFVDSTKNDFEKKEKTGVLNVVSNAVLGIYSQADSMIISDYDQIIEQFDFESFESFFLTKMHEKKSVIREEKMITPFEIDTYQEEILSGIKKGRSLVVQGPPGTGKSQLIANVIADHIADNKKVLLVCQKRVALDVVYERLSSLGIAPFVALVHDHKYDRAEIYKQINEQIEKTDAYKDENNQLDSIFIERNFLHASREIDAIQEILSDYKTALFDENICGKSVKELYLNSDIQADYFKIDELGDSLKFHSLPKLTNTYERMLTYFKKIGDTAPFWNYATLWADKGVMDKQKIITLIEEISTYESSLEGYNSDFKKPLSKNLLEMFLPFKSSMEKLYDGLEKKNSYFFRLYTSILVDLGWYKQVTQILKKKDGLLGLLSDSMMERRWKNENIRAIQTLFKEESVMNVGAIGMVRWYFSKQGKKWRNFLRKNNLSKDKEAVINYRKKLETREYFMTLKNQLRSTVNQKVKIPSSMEKEEWSQWYCVLDEAIKLYERTDGLKEIGQIINISPEKNDFLNLLKTMIKILNELEEKQKNWILYFSSKQMDVMLEKNNTMILTASVEEHFETLVEYQREKAMLTRQEEKIYELLTSRFMASDKAVEKTLEVFLNSMSIFWIHEIETHFPVLKNVSSGKLEQDILQLRKNIVTKRENSAAILKQKLKENTYQDVVFNRLGNKVTYRELQHQVNKKRKVWSLRKLIEFLREDIFSLIPCWMCSPESVSAMFSPKELFDLVIFDESSQCFTELGIPAMYKAKQMMVVGDSQQLQPFDLYRARWDDQEDVYEINVNSLLDFSKKYLQEFYLRQHYRSYFSELVEFSNHHFYGNKLSFLPKYFSRYDPPIVFQNFQGEWDKGVNFIEATEVVRLILKLRWEHPQKSLGVITFNYKQRDLIEELLEKNLEGQSLGIKDFFVKNIENVQGDEKDIILFSIGYGVDKKGVLKSQFGSLGVTGGENRLNVAITRARERIYVCVSFEPQQLKVEHTKNQGPKLLKYFLEYAKNISENQWRKPCEKPLKKEAWYLKEQVISRFVHATNYTLEQEFPTIDITVKKNSERLAILLTDDERYYSVPLKHLYGYQHEQLLKGQWKYTWVYSRNWWLNLSKEYKRLICFFESLS